MNQISSETFVLTDVRGSTACITLNRPRALNALSLDMIRDLMACLLAWREDDRIHAVALRGSHREGPFGALCAGGDIRFFHEAALCGNPALEDFFTEEYALNHLIHTYPKPFIAFMDGVVMGGGMGISQGASLRIVTERSKLAMPETNIGLFPDVGGGYFLSRCPGHLGEWLALTGHTLRGAQALPLGLADAYMDSGQLAQAWDALTHLNVADTDALQTWRATYCIAPPADAASPWADMNHFFELPTVLEIVLALQRSSDTSAQQTAATLRQRSPLMLHVVLEQVRRARHMTLADDLRMERDLVRHCFFTAHLKRRGQLSETVEGIRALAVDKDNTPHWNPSRIEDVTPEMVAPFFNSPWPAHAHPLRWLQ